MGVAMRKLVTTSSSSGHGSKKGDYKRQRRTDMIPIELAKGKGSSKGSEKGSGVGGYGGWVP